MASFSADTVADVSSISGMIKYLCENTSLTNCSEISKQLSATVENSKRLAEYTQKVKEHEELTNEAVRALDDVMENNPEEGLDAMLDLQLGNIQQLVKGYIERTSNITQQKEKLKAYLEEDDILNELKNIDNSTDFENIITSLASETKKSWWSCGISWLKEQFNYWYQKIKDFVNWLKDPKKLTIILFVLWLLLCEYNKYKQSQEAADQKCLYDSMAMRAGQGAITAPAYEPPTDILTTSCAKTEDMLNLLSTYANYAWDIIVNAFKSLFGLNTEYIIPSQINPLVNAEAWDYTISSAFTEVSYTGGCTIAAASTGVAGSIGGVAAGILGITASPAILVTGVVAGTLGLVCFAISKGFNETVVKPTINQEYLALERTLLRPYLMIIWDKVYNAGVTMLKVKGTWAEKMKYFIDACMNILDTYAAVRLNLMKNIKNQYYANAIMAFKGMQGYEFWKNGNKNVENKELTPANLEENFRARMAMELPRIDDFNTLDKITKMKILVIFKTLDQIEFDGDVLENLDALWEKNKDYIYNWYFPKSKKLEKGIPNLKF